MRRPARVSLRATIPRQHGAWSVLLLGYVLGVAAGDAPVPAALLLMALLAALPLRHTAVLWLCAPCGTGQRRVLAWWLAGYCLLLLAPLFPLLLVYQRWILVPLGSVAGCVGLATAWLEWHDRDRTLGGELLGMLGLSTAIPAAACAAGQGSGSALLALWLLGAMNFCGSVLHVRWVVRGGRTDTGRAGVVSMVYHLAIVGLAWAMGALGLAPDLAAVALLPAAARAVWAALTPGGRSVSVRRLGFEELAYTAAFVVLAALAFRLWEA